MTSSVTNTLKIRPETPADEAAIRKVNTAAFDTALEADIVEALRSSADECISLVAVQKGTIVGHILFSPVSLNGDSALMLKGLGPMAVLPDEQRKGIGTALVEAGLSACRDAGTKAVVVLGHPEFYPRFGFEPASRFGISCQYEVPDEAFMAVALVADGLAHRSGEIAYHNAFSGA